MQHGPLTPLTYPGSYKICFTCIPVFGRKVFLIFLICIIGQSDLISPLILLTSTLDKIFTHFGGYFSIFTGQLALKFYWDKTCFFRHLRHYKLHWNYSISHAKTSLFVNCAGGSQGVQLLDWSNKGQVWAIRLKWVWVSWHPSIQSWSLWIGKSTCLCEPTMPETEPANSKGNIQAHILQALKMLFGSKLH